MQNNIFKLNRRTTTDSIVQLKYRSGWLLVENFYLNGGTSIAPMKNTVYTTEKIWSEWLELMRKYVDYTFGILKGRWRILKSVIRLHGEDVVDEIWMTCCAIHNMLLDYDGLT